jgi:hypothetical protein
MNPTTKLYPITLVLLLLFLISAIANASIIYVDASKSDDNGDGQSWTTAKKYLQSALALASSGELWVAKGTYYPDEGTGQINNPLAPFIKGDNDRNSTFQLKEGVSIYGGFVGGETSRDQRNWATNPTILNGDLDQSGDKNDNDAYHVVTDANNAVLDGFTITGGNANGIYPNDSGGGMYNGSCSYPTVTNCTFSSNSATGGVGGGMYNGSYSHPTVTNCTFSNNSAGSWGGGMYNGEPSSTTVTNCTFSSNSAGFGGGMCNDAHSHTTVTNCTFSSNSAGSGGGMFNFYSWPAATNCILWGDSGGEISFGGAGGTVAYCDVQGGYAGTGNIDADPMFINPAAGDYHLGDYSPCIGAGTSEGAPAYDIEGKKRGTPPDIGAYENSRDVPLAVTLAELTAFSATDSITIKWQTATETNNLGFNIYRSDSKDGKYIKVNPRLIAGAGSDATPHDYSFTDENVALGKTYYYYIEDVDYTGKANKSHLIEVTVGKQDIKTHLVLLTFALLQNYPNPFNPETWIPFKLATDSPVTINIYGQKGQLIRTINLGEKRAGSYITRDKAAYWDGKNDLGEKVSSGVYFYTLKAGEFKATRRMLVVK